MTAQTDHPGRACILCADDEETTLTLFRRILEKAGYGYIGVSAGGQVFQAVLDYHPDLILLDVMIPCGRIPGPWQTPVAWSGDLLPLHGAQDPVSGNYPAE